MKIDPAPDRWLSVAARLLVGGVFVYAGLGKASAPAEEFAAVIEAYAILPPDWTLPFAQALPWLELIFGAYLIAGLWTRWAAVAVGTMSGMFVFALGSILWRHIPLENCGCFGQGFHLDPRLGVLFDLGLLACALWIARSPRSRWSADRWVELEYGRPGTSRFLDKDRWASAR